MSLRMQHISLIAYKISSSRSLACACTPPVDCLFTCDVARGGLLSGLHLQ